MSKNCGQRKSIDEKQQIKQVASAIDQLAKDLLSVQPMDNVRMPTILNETKWESWHRKIVIWPRRSITGKIVFGAVHRSSRDEFKVPFGVYLGDNEPKRFHRYATDKELFLARLEGEA